MQRSALRNTCLTGMRLVLAGLITLLVALTLARAGEQLAMADEADWQWNTVKLIQTPVPEPTLPATAPPVFGTDDRVELDGPVPGIARLLILGADGVSRQCTGSFVTEIALITSPQCLYDAGTRRPAKAVKVIPGAFGNTEEYGSTLATEFAVLSGYEPGAAPGEFDLAIVRVERSAFGSTLRPFDPVIVYEDGIEWFLSFMISVGYPLEKGKGAFYGQAIEGFTTTEHSFRTFADMTPGMEGAPVLFVGLDISEDFEDVQSVAGIVGMLTARGAETTVALRFTSEHIQALNDWCEPLACTIAGQRGPYRLFAPGTARVRPGPQLPPANLVHESLDLPAVGASVLQAAKVFPAELYR